VAVSTELRVDPTEQSLAGFLYSQGNSRSVFIHGFAQNARCLGPFGELLADCFELLAVDAPGHGNSVQHGKANLVQGAELLCATAGKARYIGYSMGGRLGLQAALLHPELVESLVLIGATAGIEDADERAERERWDRDQAAYLEEVGLDEFLRAWLEQPLFRGLPDWARFDSERRTNTASGLAASLRCAGTGSMTPLWDQLPSMTCPVLIITGDSDERYCQIGQRLAAQIGPNASHETIADSGHAVHLEQPQITARTVLEFLNC